MPGYNPENYVTVAERLNVAHDLIQTIVAEPPVMLTEVMGYIRCTVALSDGRSSTGTASFRTDLTGGRAQATNPIEDCETSAIGRALGMLGFGSRDGIASAEEIHEARRREAASRGAQYQEPPARAPQPRQQTPAPTNGNQPPLCPVHNKPMREGKNGGYFCATKLDDGSWCKARPIKPSADTEEWDAIDQAAASRRSN